jgi:multidrug efflux pump subunit AcrB
MGEPPEVAAEKGGNEVALPVLAATLATAVVFFPVTFLYGVSKFLFSALAVAVVLSLFASYGIAMTVVPLFCAKYLTAERRTNPEERLKQSSFAERFRGWFDGVFGRFLRQYDRLLDRALARPLRTVLALLALCVLGFAAYPLAGVSYFPKTDPGQFLINLKAPSGTRLEQTGKLVQRVEDIIRREVPSDELDVTVANIGVTPGFSSIYTSNSAQHTAMVQVSLKTKHRLSSYDYMERVRRRIRAELPQVSVYLQSGGLVDAIINLGFPAPIDIQVSGSNLEKAHRLAQEIAQQVRALPGVSDVLVPQDIDYPALQLSVDRGHAAELGLTSKEVVQNVITALTSDQMIAPSYWVDPKSGNDYLLTVQYPEGTIQDFTDLMAIPLRGQGHLHTTRLDNVSALRHVSAPTEVDHYQLRRVMDVYVSPSGENLGNLTRSVEKIMAGTNIPDGLHVTLRGVVQGMRNSFRTFELGLILAVVLVYLILLAQFKSFIDPLLILLAVPAGLAGVLLALLFTHTTLNVMSLMGVVMVVGIVASNSVLILDFTQRLRAEGMPVGQAVREACRVRMRPVLITSLATLVGLLPMAAKFGTGSEAYAPLALAIIGGLLASVVLTVFMVPAAYLLIYGKREWQPAEAETPPAKT